MIQLKTSIFEAMVCFSLTFPLNSVLLCFQDNFQKLMQIQYSLNGHHEIVQPGRVSHKNAVWLTFFSSVKSNPK